MVLVQNLALTYLPPVGVCKCGQASMMRVLVCSFRFWMYCLWFYLKKKKVLWLKVENTLEKVVFECFK